MGICGAKEAVSESSNEINRQIAEDRRRLQKEVKLLLLGEHFFLFLSFSLLACCWCSLDTCSTQWVRISALIERGVLVKRRSKPTLSSIQKHAIAPPFFSMLHLLLCSWCVVVVCAMTRALRPIQRQQCAVFFYRWAIFGVCVGVLIVSPPRVAVVFSVHCL
jgi:hypothetical protein